MQTRYEELLTNAKAHREADMLLSGVYGKQNGTFKGCSIGCHLHDIYPDKTAIEIDDLDDKHQLVSEYYGYPEWLALLQDNVFEGLPGDERGGWHVELAKTLLSLPKEYDWQTALHRVHVAILRVSYKTAREARDIVQAVLTLHERAANGETVGDEDWSAARSAARSAAWSAAWSAAYQEIRDGVLDALKAEAA